MNVHTSLTGQDATATVMTTAEATVKSLVAHGVDTVYGLPGLHSDPLFDAMHNAGDQLRVIHTRHEQATAYMALGAALVTGKPQAFSVVPGPGFLNTTAALLTAQGTNAPVLGLTGQIPRAEIERGHGYLHEIRDQLGAASHVAKYTARIEAAYQAPLILRDAFRTMQSGRPGPAVVECALDVFAQPGAVSFPADLPGAIDRAPVDTDAVERAAEILGSAERPVIVVGSGAQDASKEVRLLAEMLEAPVITYRMGRGVLPSSHRLAANLPIGHRLWRTADAVLAIGTRLFIQQGSWGIGPDMKIVRIDVDPQERDRMREPDVALTGDAAEYARALLAALPRRNRARQSQDEEMAGHNAWMRERLSRFEPQASFVRALRRAIPEEGILVEDVTQMGFASRLAFPVERPRTYISPGYQDNLGWSYGAALGAKAARPDTPVVCIAGDGGFMYQVGELATAVKHKLAVVVIVFDNGLYGNVKLLQRERYGSRFIANELANPDFVALAGSFGMAGYRATTPEELERAVSAALMADEPALIHVPCGEMPSPWDMIFMPRIF